MSKYIDADRLQAEIERLIQEAPSYDDSRTYLLEVSALIDELQQEQPQVADASKMERLNVDDHHEWSMRYAPGFREMIESTAYHFWNLAICSRKEK